MNRLLVVAMLLVTASVARAENISGQLILNSKDVKTMVLKTPAGLVALTHGPEMKTRGIDSLDGLKTCDQVDVEATTAGASRVIGTVVLQKRDDGATCALPTVPAVPVADLYQAMVAKSAFVVDVRTVEEFAKSHLDGVVNIPLTEIVARRGELPKDRPLLLHCATARRSGIAVLMLKEKGIEARNVKGKFVVKDGKPQLIE